MARPPLSLSMNEQILLVQRGRALCGSITCAKLMGRQWWSHIVIASTEGAARSFDRGHVSRRQISISGRVRLRVKSAADRTSVAAEHRTNPARKEADQTHGGGPH